MPEYQVNTWFERDRAMVRVVNSDTDQEVACWWDEDVYQLVEDGFLNSRDWENSAIEYCQYLKLI